MFTSIYKHALKNLSCIIVKTDNVPSHQVLCLNQVRIWFWHHTTITRLIKSRSDVSILNNRDLVCFTTPIPGARSRSFRPTEPFFLVRVLGQNNCILALSRDIMAAQS